MRKLYPSDIIANCKPVTDFKFYCVYFLIQNSRIVYVGYSTNFGSRISAHMNSEKVFDSYYLIRCETESEALELEKHYIQTINPYFNTTHCDKRKVDNNGVLKRVIDKKVSDFSEKSPKIKHTRKPLCKNDFTNDEELYYSPKVEKQIVFADNVETAKIDFKIPKNSYMRKNDGYYYFSLNNEVYRAKSDLEKYFIKGCLYMPVGVFGSMDSILTP